MSISTTSNVFARFRSTYGPEIVSIINNRIHVCKLEASWANHRVFNVRCIHKDVIPQSLHMIPPDRSDRSIRAAKVAERIFLRQRIYHCGVRLNEIRERAARLDESISRAVSEEDYETLQEIVSQRYQHHNAVIKQRQRRKLDRILTGLPNGEFPKLKNNIIKPVVNLSDRQLSETEMNILNKGLNFNVSKKVLRPLDVIPSIEDSLNSLSEADANKARAQVCHILKRQKPQQSNLSNDERKALNELRSDSSIVVTKSDKGNQVVVMNRLDYDNKAAEHIQTGPYELLPLSKHRCTLNKAKADIANFLRKVKTTLGKSLWFSLYPKTSSASRFYGLPKIHKPGVPLRPIIDYTSSPAYELAKHIARVLKPLESPTAYSVKNSLDLIEKLKNLTLDSDDCFLSFDIVSLFTNVPVAESLSIIRTKLQEDTTLANRSKLSVEEIVEATKLCIDCTFFCWRGDVYQQTAGVAMGSPISPIIANLFMQKYEETIISTCEFPPKQWWRYVDDTLVVMKRSHVPNFFDFLNQSHPNIKFTMENETTNRCISFLDCLIQVDEEGNLNTTVHRKDTHSNRYLSHGSDHPMCVKKSVASNLFRRASILTSSDHKKAEEERFITSVLLENGYNARFIMNSKRAAVLSNTVKREWISTAVIPYRRNTSEDIRRVLSQYNIRVTFQATNTLGRMLVHLKDPLERMHQANCVYMIQCSDCDACYIGQTARQLGIRMKEHERCTHKLPTTPEEWRKIESDSAIALHAIVSGHSLDLTNTRILKHGFRSYKHRLTTETLLINTTANVVNRSEGAELSPIWFTLSNRLATSRPSPIDPVIQHPDETAGP